jgi:crossover junction endodeoxyribonuclease RuvC
MTRILGIDPGSRITGYGIIESDGNHSIYVSSGCIHTRQQDLPQRLKIIFDSVLQLVKEHKPDEFAIEQVFVHRNADSALKLGQARGAALCACMSYDMPVGEYSPRAIKQAVVGTGKADKEQVQHMVRILLNLNDKPAPDAADALAVALCHGHTMHTNRQFLERRQIT